MGFKILMKEDVDVGLLCSNLHMSLCSTATYETNIKILCSMKEVGGSTQNDIIQ